MTGGPYKRLAGQGFDQAENQAFHDELAAATRKFADAEKPWELLDEIMAYHSLPDSCLPEKDRERHFRHVVHQFVKEVSKRLERDAERASPRQR